MTKWVFAELDPAAVRRDPNETQLFKDDQAGEEPVRVRLSLHGAGGEWHEAFTVIRGIS